MSRYSLISVEAIISKSIRSGLDSVGFSEGDVVEMIGEALEFIGAYGQYEESIKYLKVENYKVALPDDLVEIIQMAYTEETGESLEYEYPEDPKETGRKECWAEPNKYYIPDQRYYDLIASYMSVQRLNKDYYNNYKPLKLNKTSFSLAMHCSECINLYCDSEHTYTIQDRYIHTTFQEGTICINYLKQPVDDRGYPLIPDIISYKEAIDKYLKKVHAEEMFFQDPTPANEKRLMKFESDWHWYCRQAKNASMMPQNLDERENLYTSNQRLIKRRRGYSNFFAFNNSPDNLDWNNGRTRR